MAGRRHDQVHQEGATRSTQRAFSWRLTADPSSVGAVRQAFSTWLQQRSTDEELLEDMSVVVSELASNALDGGEADAPVAEVRADLDGDVLEVVVSNRLPEGVADIRHWDLDDPLRGGGRGLMIVRAYTDTLAVDSTGGTVSVRCTRRLDAAS